MTNDPSWELYRSYLGVLREGSLSGAARSLGLAQPTVGRHIETLETSLGLALFTRSPSGLIPTPAALELKPHAEAMGHAAAALLRAAGSQGEVKGSVRVSASEVIGAEVLPPIVARLRAAHPGLQVELVLTNRVEDLLRREADIAVRMTRPRQDALLARHVGVIEVGLHAHRRYLRERGTPRAFADLAHHALIGFDEETPFIRAASKTVPGWRRQAFSLRTDSDLAQLALIRAGAGIGVCQVALARSHRDLVRVLTDDFAYRMDTWVTMHEDLRHSPRCKAAFDALAQGLQQHIG